MEAYQLPQLQSQRIDSNKLYLEFLRHPSMSMGLYVLPAGGVDPQEPHTEDEIYYIVAGRGQIQVGQEDAPVQAGSIVFVPARVEHRFHSITDALQILVFFAPAEYSNQ